MDVKKPLVKWAGGKTRMVEKIASFFPERFARILEPFAGSAVLSLQYPEKSGIISDACMPLIRFHATVASLPPSQVRMQAGRMDDEYNKIESMSGKKDFYYAIRSEFNRLVASEYSNGSSDRIRMAILFWFLNKTCFNGLYRVNGYGEFNVPFGGRKSLNLAGHDIEFAHEGLRRKQIYHCHYTYTVSHAHRGDLIYADPPYHSDDNGFTGYSGAFGMDEQGKLAVNLRMAHERGVHIIASNSDTELVRDLYSWATINEVEAPTSISRDPESRGMRKELIITALVER